MKIVVGTDGSDDAQRGVEWAATYAHKLNAEVVTVYSIELVYPAAPLRDAGVPYRTIVADGNAAAALEQIATDEGAELIVIGRKGRGGFQELVLGSVSHQLLHHTRHSVVVVPPASADASSEAD